MSGESDEHNLQLAVSELSPAMKWGMWGLAIGGFLVLALSFWHVWLPGLAFGFLVSAVPLSVLRSPAFLREPREVSIRVTPEGVWRQGRRLAARSRIAEGVFLGSPHAPGSGHIVLRNRRGGIVLEAEATEQEARLILSTLGVDVAQQRLTRRTPLSPSIVAMLWMVASAFVFLPFVGTNWSPLGCILAALVVMSLSKLLRQTVIVGAEGVLKRLGPWARLYRYDDIAGVELLGKALFLQLKSGTTVRLCEIVTKDTPPEEWLAKSDVAERIRQAIGAQKGGDLPDVSSLLSLRGRKADEWRRALEKIRVGITDYRNNAVDPDTLWQVVEDTRCDPSARLGAAVVLRPQLDEAGLERLATAAQAVASPKVRLALQSVARPDGQAELEALVAQLEAEQRMTSR